MMESVADRLLRWKPAGHAIEEFTQTGYLEQIKARMRNARKFLFDVRREKPNASIRGWPTMPPIGAVRAVAVADGGVPIMSADQPRKV
jgi:hypothetical protein